MGIFDALRNAVGDGVTLYECRDCGETLDADRDDCPSCGSTEIARYVL